MDDPGRAISVLYVDDDVAFGELAATYLEREADTPRLDVTTVSDAPTALDELDSGRRIDCVVSDYEMPGTDGLDLLSAIRSRWPALPFLLVTGRGSEEIARDAFREGATDYVRKSAGADHFAVVANRIVNAVTQYRAQRASSRYGSALSALDSAVFLLDGDGRYTSVDALFAERVGADRHDLLGRHVSAVGSGELVAGFETVSVGSGSETTQFEIVLDGDDETAETAETDEDDPGTRYVVRMTWLGSDVDRGGVVGTLSRGVETDDDGADLRSLVDFQEVVLDASTSLMSAETDEVGAKVHWTLQSVAEFADLDRCYVYETDGTTPPTLRREWTRDRALSPPAVLADWRPVEWLPTRLRRFENVRIVDVADLPSGDTAPRDLLGSAGAAVVVPLVSDWELRGFVGFETIDPPREWTDTEVSMFRTVADTVAHAFTRQRRERTLRRQNDRLEGFASIVSHDLRNPLNVVKGFVDLARETGDVSHLDRATAAIDRMEALIDDVLTLSREGRTVGDATSVDLADVAREAWRAVETAEATLVVDDAGVVSADPDRVRSVFENLFRNAVEHAGDDTTVRVGPLGDGARTGFYVEDDGPGVPEGERDRVFEEGYSTGEAGSGLGLAIVADVIDAHDWVVDVTTASTGGARFEVVTGPEEADDQLTAPCPGGEPSD